MSCEDKKPSCVCKLLAKIAEKQSANPDCLGGCRESLGELRCNDTLFNTVPFQLICSNTQNTAIPGTCGTVFVARGFRRNPNIPGTILTATSTWFRVSRVDTENCCAELELLCETVIDPAPVVIECLTNVTPIFTRTGICITVDLDCFCGITCAPAVFASDQPIPAVAG